MLSRRSGQSGWTIDNIEYGQDVKFDISVPVESEAEFIRVCQDLSGGALVPSDPQRLFMKGGSVTIS